MCHNCIAEHDDPTTKMGDSIQLNGYNTLITEYVCVCVCCERASSHLIGNSIVCISIVLLTARTHSLTDTRKKGNRLQHSIHGYAMAYYHYCIEYMYKLSTVCLLVFMPRYTNFRFHVAHLQIDSQINHWKLVALFVLSCVCVYLLLCRSSIPPMFVIAVTIIVVLAKCLPESEPLTMQIVVTNNV